MNQPSFSKLLMYVTVFIIGGGLYNYFYPQSSINEQESSYFEEERIEQNTDEDSEIIFKRADFGVLNYPMNSDKTPKKILIETQDGFAPLLIRDIIYCEKNGRYLEINLKNGQEFRSKMTLTALKTKIEDPFFIYDELNSYIINFDFVKEVIIKRSNKNKNSYSYSIIMTDSDTTITLPKDKKPKFMSELERYITLYQ